MPAPRKLDKVNITQSISINAKIKFTDICNTFDKIAINARVRSVGTGVVLEKLIQKYGHELTMEDFNPDMFVGNELKEQK